MTAPTPNAPLFYARTETMTSETRTVTGTMVLRVSRDGATVLHDGRENLIPWDVLREAAGQSDPVLRSAYAGLLAVARRTADGVKDVDVCLVDHTNTNLRTVQCYTVDGRFVRLTNADEGGQLPYHLAAREQADVVARLRAKGYVVYTR